MASSHHLLQLIISHNVDVALLIFQHIGNLPCLECASLVCKASNRVLNDTDAGRQLWLNLGIQLTTTTTTTIGDTEGFDERQIRQRFQPIRERKEFFWHLRLLVCPWHSMGRALPLTRNDTGFNFESLFFADADETRLQVQGQRLPRNNNNNYGGLSATTFPARLLSGSEEDFRIFTRQVEVNQEWVIPRQPVQNNNNNNSVLEQRAVDKEIVPDFSHDRGCMYRYFPIHAGAFAVVESFSPLFDNDRLVDHGVYFMSHGTKTASTTTTTTTAMRVLRHMKCEDAVDVDRCFILSRPCEMWILMFDSIVYYGPSCPPRPGREDDDLGHEFMDEALWKAGSGDAQGAIDHMTSKGIRLDHPSLISNRTLLHYAAKEGHAEAVRQLLRAGFRDVDAEDDFGHTALCFAVAELHLEVVEVLLKEGNARPSGVNEDSSCLSMLGDFVQYRPYALSIDRTKDEIARIVPAMVNLLVEADPCILGNSDCHFTQASILSSPEAMRVLLRRAIAEDDPPCFNDVCCRFGSFRNRVQELSAVESLYVLVREFGVVKEHPIGGPPLFDCALVVLVGNALSEAVVMMIDNIGADPRVVSSRGKTLRQIAQERASNRHPVDPEGQRILDFLDARGL